MLINSDDDLVGSSRVTHGTLQQVRTGRIKPVFGPGIKSAIFKTPVAGPVKVNRLGCEDDQQSFHEHGGPDKALLQYCSSHYDAWRKELPYGHELVSNGAFGENLVASGVDENDVCIGDVIRVGKEVLVSVCEPRQPCYMLNHRFKTKDMSKRAQDSGRTGWYLRVLQDGLIEAGDEMVLVARPNPKWSVRQVQHYLYRDLKNEQAMKELVELDGLGQSIKDLFAMRLRKQMENQDERLHGTDEAFHGEWTDYTVVKKSYLTPRILSVKFKAEMPADGLEIAPAGSHVRLKLAGDLVRAYSIVAGGQSEFELGIALSETSRGGSQFIHKDLKEGAKIAVSKIATSFPLHQEADKHVFIAGGIGITAFIPSIRKCKQEGWPFHLHYLVRNSEDIAFKGILSGVGSNVTIYDKSAGKVFDADAVFRKADSLSHVYCCGSQRLMTAVKEAASACGLSEGSVHFEAFEVDTSGDPFVANLQKSNKALKVGARQTLLDVLRDAGFEMSSSCEVGNCGTCRVDLLDGRVEHRGTGLMEWEKSNYILSCVSRGVGTISIDV